MALATEVSAEDMIMTDVLPDQSAPTWAHATTNHYATRTQGTAFQCTCPMDILATIVVATRTTTSAFRGGAWATSSRLQPSKLKEAGIAFNTFRCSPRVPKIARRRMASQYLATTVTF